MSDVMFVTGRTEWKNKELNKVTFLPEVHNTAISLLKSHDLYS